MKDRIPPPPIAAATEISDIINLTHSTVCSERVHRPLHNQPHEDVCSRYVPA